MKLVEYFVKNQMFKVALDTAEKKIYVAAYEHAKHRQSKAAKSLGVARGTFISKMKKWGALK